MASNYQRMTFEIDTKVNTSEIQRLQSELQKVKTAITQYPEFRLGEQVNSALTAVEALQNALTVSFDHSFGTINIQKFNSEINKSSGGLANIVNQLNAFGVQGQQAVNSIVGSLYKMDAQLGRTTTFLDKIGQTFSRTISWGIASSVWRSMTSSISKSISYVKELDESLNKIRIVSGENTEQMAQFAVQANKAAEALGSTTTKYTDAALIYYQQGLSDEEVLDRTNITVKMANVLGESADTVSSHMTAIWNNFDDGTKTLEEYGDIVTALGATTAASATEIASGLEKFASVAETTGVSYEYATSMLATIVSVTRQSEDTVGTGLRTILARLESLNLGETLDDGVTLTKYTKALEAAGISVLNTNGQLKEGDEILNSIAEKWQTMTNTQKQSLAYTVGGVRQYSNLIALFDNWDKMTDNLETAAKASGTLDKEQSRYMESLSAHVNELKSSLQELYTNLLDSDDLIKMTDALKLFVKLLSNITQSLGGLGPILGIVSSSLLTIFSKQISVGLVDLQNNLSRSTMEAERLQQQMSMSAQITKEYGEIPGLDNIVNRLMEMYQYAGLFNDKERETYEQTRLNIIEFENQKLELIAIGEQLERNAKLGKISLGFGGVTADDLRKSQTYTAFGTGFKDSAFDEESFTGLASKFRTGELDSSSFVTGNKIYDDLQSTTEFVLRGADISGEAVKTLTQHFMKLVTTMNGDVKRAFQTFKIETNAALDGKSVKEYIKTTNGLRDAQTRQAEAALKQSGAQKLFTQNLSKGIGQLGQFAMGVNTIVNAIKVWQNSNLSLGEKLLQTFTSLTFAIGMVAKSYKTLGSTRELLQAWSAIELGKEVKISEEKLKQYGLDKKLQASKTKETLLAEKQLALEEKISAAQAKRVGLGLIFKNASGGIISNSLNEEQTDLFKAFKANSHNFNSKTGQVKGKAFREFMRATGLSNEVGGRHLSESELYGLLNKDLAMQEEIEGLRSAGASAGAEFGEGFSSGSQNPIKKGFKKIGAFITRILTSPWGLAVIAAGAAIALIYSKIKEQQKKVYEARQKEIEELVKQQEEVSNKLEKIENFNALIESYDHTEESVKNLSEAMSDLSEYLTVQQRLAANLSEEYEGLATSINEAEDSLWSEQLATAQKIEDNVKLQFSSGVMGDDAIGQSWHGNYRLQLKNSDTDQLAEYKKYFEKYGLNSDSVFRNNFGDHFVQVTPDEFYSMYSAVKDMLDNAESVWGSDYTTNSGWVQLSEWIKQEQITSNIEGLETAYQIRDKNILRNHKEELNKIELSNEEFINEIFSIVNELMAQDPSITFEAGYKMAIAYAEGLSSGIQNKVANADLVQVIAEKLSGDSFTKVLGAKYNGSVLKNTTITISADNTEAYYKEIQNVLNKLSDETKFSIGVYPQLIPPTTSKLQSPLWQNALDDISEAVQKHQMFIQLPGLISEDKVNSSTLTTVLGSNYEDVLGEGFANKDNLGQLFSLYNNFDAAQREFEDNKTKAIQQASNLAYSEEYISGLKTARDNASYINTEGFADFILNKVDEKDLDDVDAIRAQAEKLGFTNLTNTMIADAVGQRQDGATSDQLIEFLNGAGHADTIDGISAEKIEEYNQKIAEAEAYNAGLEAVINDLNNTQLSHTQIVEIATNLQEKYNNEVDALQSAYKIAIKAQEEYNEHQGYSIDTAQELLKLEPKYLRLIMDESGKININEDSLRELTRARYQDSIAAQQLAFVNKIEAIAKDAASEATREQAKSELQNLLITKASAEGTDYFATRLEELANDSNLAALGIDNLSEYLLGYNQTLEAMKNNIAFDDLGFAMDGASSSADDLNKTLEDEFDQFWRLQQIINVLTDSLTDLSKIQDHLAGRDYIDSLKEQNELLTKQAQAQKDLLNAKKLYAGSLQGDLKSFVSNIQFDETGNITNYEDVIKSAFARRDEEGYDKFKTALGNYQSVVSELISLNNEIDDAVYAMIENNLKAFDLELKLHIDVKDVTKEINDFKKEVLKDFTKNALSVNEWTETFDIIKSNATTLNNEAIKQRDEQLKQIESIINNDNYDYGSPDSMFASKSEAMAKYVELGKEQLDDEKELYNLYKESYDTYLEAIDAGAKQFQDVIKEFESLAKRISQMSKINKLLTNGNIADSNEYIEQRRAEYDALDEIYSGQIKTASTELDQLKAEYNALSDDEKESKAGLKLKEDIDTATESLATATEKYLQNAQDKIKYNIDVIIKQLDKNINGGYSSSTISEKWQDEQKRADGYYDSVQRVMKLEQLESKWQSSINSTSNLKNQQKLKSLMDSQLDNLKSKTKLSEYNIQLAEKELAVAQAEIALEEAQNNKNAMTLVRDSSGNWTYQYVADEANLQEKQNNLLNALSDKYDFVKQKSEETFSKELEYVQEYENRMKQLATLRAEQAISEADYVEQQKYLTDLYWGEDGLITNVRQTYIDQEYDLREAAMESIWGLYETDKSSYETMTDEEKKLIDSLKTQGVQSIVDLATELGGKDKGKWKDVYDNAKSVTDSIYTDGWSQIKDKVTADWNKNSAGNVYDTVNQAWTDLNKEITGYAGKVEKAKTDAGTHWDEITGYIEGARKEAGKLNKRIETLTSESTLTKLGTFKETVDTIATAWKGVYENIDTATSKLATYQKQLMNSQGYTSNNNPNLGITTTQGSDAGDGGGSGNGKTAYSCIICLDSKEIGRGNSFTSSTAESKAWTNLTENGYNKNDYTEKSRKTVTNGNITTTTIIVEKKNNTSTNKILHTNGLGSNVSLVGAETGGYTGSWNDKSGKLALLHSKELVLNASDTENMLDAVSAVRDVASFGSSVTAAVTKGIASMIHSALGMKVGSLSGFNTVSTTNDDHTVINITAPITSTADVDEIKEVILSLPTMASQYLSQRKF